jgi:hypothetical protein
VVSGVGLSDLVAVPGIRAVMIQHFLFLTTSFELRGKI